MCTERGHAFANLRHRHHLAHHTHHHHHPCHHRHCRHLANHHHQHHHRVWKKDLSTQTLASRRVRLSSLSIETRRTTASKSQVAVQRVSPARRTRSGLGLEDRSRWSFVTIRVFVSIRAMGARSRSVLTTRPSRAQGFFTAVFTLTSCLTVQLALTSTLSQRTGVFSNLASDGLCLTTRVGLSQFASTADHTVRPVRL